MEKRYNFVANVAHRPTSDAAKAKTEELKAKIKMYEEHKARYKFLDKYIGELNTSLQEVNDEAWVVTVKLGKHCVEAGLPEEPTQDDIKDLQEQLKEKLSEKRQKVKETQPERREILGFEYDVVGGVFTEPGSVLKIGAKQNKMRRIRQRKIPHKLIRANYVGIELEFYCKVDRDHLEKLLADAGLASSVTVKDDVSIKPTEERPHRHEINVLTREEWLDETITKVCNVINSPTVSAEVNSSCGLHVHLDVRNRDYKKVFYNLTGALPFLSKLVPPTRVNNRYCVNNTLRNFDEFLVQTGVDRRRQAINGEAYNKYRTIEVRMHSGSTNAVKIINWCRVLTTIAASEIALGDEVATLEDYSKFYRISDTMYSYLKARIEQLSSKVKTTEDDYVDTTTYEVVA